MSKTLNLAATKEPAPKATGAKKQTKKAAEKPKRRWIAATASAAILFAVVASTGLAVAHYSDKILPGVNVAGVNVGGKTRAQAEALLRQNIAKLQILIQDGQTTWRPTPEQLGVTYDLPATVEAAYAEGRTGAVGDRFGALSGVGLPFVVHYNSGVTDSFIANIVHATSKEPSDATLAVKGGTVKIVPETIGQTTGVENAAQRIRAILGHPASLSMTVSEITLQPKVTAANLEQPLAQAQGMVNLPVTITSSGKTFTATTAQKAGWLDFAADTANHTQKVSFNSTRVQGFVASVVKSLTVQPQPQEIGVNLDENGAQSVLQQGQNGQTVGNADALSSGLIAALTAGKPFTGAVTTSVVPFGVKHMNIYDRWIEVNLSTQRMVAWQKGTSVLNVLISSGIPMFPTPTGTFHIYGKSRVTEMKGELGTPFAYDLPNVQWVSWWLGSYSIHGTYWHHNFGHVMSHGCVNATNADAQFIYNWAPVGTAVVVHR